MDWQKVYLDGNDKELFRKAKLVSAFIAGVVTVVAHYNTLSDDEREDITPTRLAAMYAHENLERANLENVVSWSLHADPKISEEVRKILKQAGLQVEPSCPHCDAEESEDK